MDLSWSFSAQLPLAFRLHTIDVIYSLERGVLKIRWLKGMVKNKKLDETIIRTFLSYPLGKLSGLEWRT